MAQTLGWIGDERAVNSLLWALKDEEPSVVSAAAYGREAGLVVLRLFLNFSPGE